jgi:hypothetical protein
MVKGIVRDNRNNPVAGASISIKDSYDGATSDSAGRFSFRTLEKGRQVLVISSIGYRPVELQVELTGSTLTTDPVLKEEVTELSAVVLSAGTFEASDRKRAAAVLDPIDIVTTASANGDITGALKTLPGAQQVGESEGLFVRGGTAAETKTFIDGTLVNNFFFSSVPNIAQFSRFSPFIFKGTVFSTGGYSALYGQALSSALILESIDLPEQSSANIGLTVLSGNAGIQQLTRTKKASWGLNYSYTDLRLAFSLIRQRQDYSRVPVFHNLDANFRIQTSKTGMLKYYGYYSTNRLGFTTPSLDSVGFLDRFSLQNNNHYHNLSWRETLPRRWKLQLGASYTRNRDIIDAALQDEQGQDRIFSGLEFKDFGLYNKGQYWNGKAVLEKKWKGLSAIRFGVEYNGSDDRPDYTASNGQLYSSRVSERLLSLFGEGDVYATNQLALKAGLRFERSNLLGRSNLAPRLSLAYKLGKGTQASLAYGIFYQNPERRYLPAVRPLDFTKAVHYILQFQRVIDQRSLRIEAFYKKYDRLIKTGASSFNEIAISNAGFGDAKGFELFWRDKKSVKDFDYWVSYSYLDTRRDFLNFPFAITPNFAARHTASFVAKKFVSDWKMNFNAAYNLASGRPHYFIAWDGSAFRFADRGRVPAYHNVSLALNYLPFIGKKDAKAFAVYVLQVSNIFNVRQVYGYQYSYNGLRRQTIEPPSRMFVFLGAFISFGVDRSDEVMNNAL